MCQGTRTPLRFLRRVSHSNLLLYFCHPKGKAAPPRDARFSVHPNATLSTCGPGTGSATCCLSPLLTSNCDTIRDICDSFGAPCPFRCSSLVVRRSRSPPCAITSNIHLSADADTDTTALYIRSHQTFFCTYSTGPSAQKHADRTSFCICTKRSMYKSRRLQGECSQAQHTALPPRNLQLSMPERSLRLWRSVPGSTLGCEALWFLWWARLGLHLDADATRSIPTL